MDLQSTLEPGVQRISSNVKRYKLANGLTLLVKENHNSPVAASLIYVKAGYFHEADRVNGIAHVIEHMMFKGTPRRPEEEQFAREIRELGGSLNASTYYDQTSYHVIVPAAELDHAFEIQSDAVQNARMDADALSKEIEVIVQESLQKRDNPNSMLIETLYELAYDEHRIRRWRIGHPETLRGMTRDDLKQFVTETYRPENMIIAIVGDVDSAEVRAMVERQWNRYPKGSPLVESGPSEPERTDFRYRRITSDTRQRLLCFHFPAPSILHEDSPAMMVLSAILSDGRSSRLFRKLREELRVANSSWASYDGFESLGMFLLGAESHGADPRPAERALWSEILRVQMEKISEGELRRIKRRVESQRLYAQEEVLGMARTLAGYEALGTYELTDTLLEKIRLVTAEDVQRVACRYLRLEGASLVEYLPSQDHTPEFSADTILQELAAAKSDLVIQPASPTDSLPEPAHHTFHVSRNMFDAVTRGLALPWGGHLIYKTRRDLPLVSITALFQGGKRGENLSSCGITNLMLKSCLKGTQKYSAEELANRIEGLGSGIGISASSDFFGFGMKIKRDVLSEGFDIFSDVLVHPTFPQDEIEREKQAVLAEIRRQQDNIGSVAMDLFSAAYYGEDHPYGLPAVGSVDAIQPLMRTDLLMWHQRHVIAQNLVVGLVGDIDENEVIDLFSGLLEKRTTSRAERLPMPLQGAQSSPDRVLYRQKQQTAAVMGFHGAGVYSEDRHVLDVLAEITSGMGGRFFRAVRGEHALAYQVAAFHRVRQESGNFITYAATSPENEEVARDLILRECELLMREPVTTRELEAARAAIVGQYTIGSQTFSAQSVELATIGIYGLPIEEPQQYLERIATVTADDIMDAAQRYLDPRNSWLGVVRGSVAGR